jgi:hypothetical protein
MSRKRPAQQAVLATTDTSGARHRDVDVTSLRNRLRTCSVFLHMRLILLSLPVIITVLTLVACGGKGGGGY